MASIQKAMSVATGALGPATKTMAISISQLADVSAVSPLSDSDRFMPPMLRPGSRYRPKAQRAASQKGVSRMNSSGAAVRVRIEGRDEPADHRHVVERPGHPDRQQ